MAGSSKLSNEHYFLLMSDIFLTAELIFSSENELYSIALVLLDGKTIVYH
jgi:hypothetical protein